MIRLAFFAITLFLTACSGHGDIIQQEQEYVEAHILNNPDITHQSITVDQHQLHYIINGDADKPAFIIIHGTPGSWQQYSRYALNEALLAHFQVVVIDRPGWGGSVLGNELDIASFELQARIVAELAKQLKQQSQGQPVIVMGHSLGGSLLPRLAMDHPQWIDGLLLLAGTVDPELSSPRWFNYAGRIPFVPYLVGDDLHRANKEVFALKDNINAMEGRWHEITAQVIAVQGTEDGLVYPGNSDFIEKSFNPESTQVIRLEGEGHLFPMTRRDDVVRWAKELLDVTRKE